MKKNCFLDIYIEKNTMKLKTFVQEEPKRRIKMIITENQFRTLAGNVLLLQEQNQIRKTYLIKTNTNAQKK